MSNNKKIHNLGLARCSVNIVYFKCLITDDIKSSQSYFNLNFLG